MIEYGYALKSLTCDKTILVMNTNYGEPPEIELPFNISHINYPIMYELPEGSDTARKRDVKLQLTKSLKRALKNLILSLDNKGSLQLKWSDDFIIRRFVTMHNEIDSKKAVAEDQLNNLVLETTITDLVSGKPCIIRQKKGIENYACQLNQYISELEKFKSKSEGFLLCSADYAINTSLTINNSGSKIANNITICVGLPQWLKIGFNAGGTNHLPRPPSCISDSGSTYNSTPPERFNARKQNWVAISDTELKITDYPDQVLHARYTLLPQKFFLIATPDAPTGVHKLHVRIICNEYDGWQDSAIKVEVTGEQP